MRAILIDPIARTISETEHNGDYRDIYRLLSDPEHGLEVDDFNTVLWNNRNVVFVDGEGLLKNPRYFFTIRGYLQPLAGRGLILGLNGPETIATDLTLRQVRPSIGFQELSVQGFTHEEGKTKYHKHPLFGDEEVNVIRQTPVFGPPENDNGD